MTRLPALPALPPHRCRGRGGRCCRCHVARRAALARLVLTGEGRHPLHRPAAPAIRPLRLRRAPNRPQAPPLSASEPCMQRFRTETRHDFAI